MVSERLSGAALAWHRRRVGLTQSALARALHCSPAAVRDLERGHAPLPTEAQRAAILAALRAARFDQLRYEQTRRHTC